MANQSISVNNKSFIIMKKIFLSLLLLLLFVHAQMCQVNGQAWSVYNPAKEPSNKIVGFPSEETGLYKITKRPSAIGTLLWYGIQATPALLFTGLPKPIMIVTTKYIGSGKTEILTSLGTPIKRNHTLIDEFPNEAIHYDGLELVFIDDEAEERHDMMTLTGKDLVFSKKFKLQVGECVPYEVLRDYEYKAFSEGTNFIHNVSWGIAFREKENEEYHITDYLLSLNLDSNGRITEIYTGPF